MTNEQIAKIVYDIYSKVIKCVEGVTVSAWEEADILIREQITSCVNFYVSNPELGPEDAHVLWLDSMKDDGWVYAPVANYEKKEHPYIVDYDKIPNGQRWKDAFYHALVIVLFNEVNK